LRRDPPASGVGTGGGSVMEKSMTRLRSASLPKDMIMALSKNGLITIPAWVAHFLCFMG